MDLSFRQVFTVCEFLLVAVSRVTYSHGSQAPIEISCKIQAVGYAYIVHHTVLFHKREGYYNSFTVSPRQEAAQLIFERGLQNEDISHGFYSENVFQMKGSGGLYIKYSICLSMLIYKPRLVNKGGLYMGVAHPMNIFPNTG